MDFDGYAIGGVSVGEPESEMMKACRVHGAVFARAPTAICHGTGNARAVGGIGRAWRGHVRLRFAHSCRAQWHGFYSQGERERQGGFNKADFRPIEEGCECFACRHFTRAYLRHLLNVNEILGLRMVSVHNSYMYLRLMADIRAHIGAGTFSAFAINSSLTTFRRKRCSRRAASPQCAARTNERPILPAACSKFSVRFSVRALHL
jgi:queuine tRNA-ribosyltransferase